MTLTDYAGLIIVAAIWGGIVMVLCRMLGFNRLDENPDERDPYN